MKNQDREKITLRAAYARWQNSGFNNSRRHPKNRKKISFELYAKTVMKPCFYCGEVRGRIKDASSEFVLAYNGIDRVNSSRGYVEGNIVSCCKHCNRAKNSMTMREFEEWIKDVYRHFIGHERRTKKAHRNRTS